jgi:hypothetical protein
MNRLEHRIERDLRQIADRATPSPDAWDTILARIADQEPDTETEIIMLTEATPRSTRRWLLLASAAAAVVAIIAAAVIAFAVSSSDDDQTPSPAATVAPNTVAPNATRPVCPNVTGGACLGVLAAGTYTSTTFEPVITYTVPDGWLNNLDRPGYFDIGPMSTDRSSPTYNPDRPSRDTRGIGIFRNLAIPKGCEERPDPAIDPTIAAMTEWLTSHPGLITSQPEQVKIGGLLGTVIDMRLDPSWTGTCPFSVGQPIVQFLVDPVGGLSHTMDPGAEERLYLLRHGSDIIVIEVYAEKPIDVDPADWTGPSIEELAAFSTPILDEIHFGE